MEQCQVAHASKWVTFDSKRNPHAREARVTVKGRDRAGRTLFSHDQSCRFLFGKDTVAFGHHIIAFLEELVVFGLAMVGGEAEG